MSDLRAVGYHIGLLLCVLGLTMAVPLALDLWAASANWRAFAVGGTVTLFIGGALGVTCADRARGGLSIRQALMLTTSLWAIAPVFAAVPFLIGAPGVSFTNGYFEAMSGLTTTGSTVFVGLDAMPPGVLIWRAMLQWFGGIGIIVVALAIFPSLGVGGMQLFKTESFDTMGKVLPRASEIAVSVSWVYLILTLLCAFAYGATGMSAFDAFAHAMTTIATGGFANYDASFGAFSPPAEYVATAFMLLASLPLARFVQLVSRQHGALFRDSQVRAFLAVMLAASAAIVAWRMADMTGDFETVLRKSLFNTASVLTGTGFASEDYALWGSLPVAVLFMIGLVGGCSGSATCALKVFRFQVLIAAVGAQVRAIHSPSGVFTPRYEGRKIDDAVLSSVMSLFYFFALTLATVAVALAMMGLDATTAISGAATALANIGPGFGDVIGPSGNFASLPDNAKWLLSLTMLIGRLEVLSIFVLFTAAFWRA
ncbi:MAG: potassium transporter TrkH [Deltaproteobacteria bacterium HGW-Deltaproteobacteria-19]|nr:MAG: potassium transporter TrkH [Deltaproteobacteria bacterium HGW-Deltaproteobacteria-19]